jgi:multicopper oxidase
MDAVSRRDFVGRALASVAAGIVVPRSLVGSSPLRVREFTLRAAPGEWDVGIGGRSRPWLFNGTLPGPLLRVREGETVRVTLENGLPEPTTIHWHGIPVPFAMDGVPELTQPAVPPGGRFTYEFAATVPGTYWYHSHFGYQFERGLFGALIVEPSRESLAFDREEVLVLDDWLLDPDHPVPSAAPYNMNVGGVSMGMMAMDMTVPPAGTPADTGAAGLRALNALRMGAPVVERPAGMSLHASHGEPQPEPVFGAYTVNGLAAATHPGIAVRHGERLRFRFVNASTATVFPVYIAGHRMTVTHLDGQEVVPYTADALPIGMGERCDVIVEATNPGIWRIGSSDPLHRSRGFGLALRYEGVSGSTIQDVTPPLVRRMPYQGLNGVTPPAPSEIDREYRLSFRMGGPSAWTINGKLYPDGGPLEVRQGERVRLRLTNNSMFAHPVHLHGHFFDVVRPYDVETRTPIRKDTITLYHMDTHVVEFTADNPGPRWFLHCHNQYHHVGGMAVEVRYL